MLPDRDGRVTIRANMEGEVEIRARAGQTIVPRQILAVVEGDCEIESLSVRRTSRVVQVMVADGAEVPKGTALMVVQEIPED